MGNAGKYQQLSKAGLRIVCVGVLNDISRK